MVGRVLRKLWNRRKDNQRVSLEVVVNTTDPDGHEHQLMSEDMSASGVRLRFEKVGLARILGHREEIPLEISLANEDTIVTQAQLVWAYNTAQGGSVSGWRFVDLAGSARRRLLDFFDAQE
ncbi:MAG: PilZ domain-containing protein [Candidatus Latescibacteria bacterium]|jgi:c-di-GMP-binding flagellar brake protein YcgR|nr:PilZ domain-containing protein [Candidatus Latescibacterota bacterium]